MDEQDAGLSGVAKRAVEPHPRDVDLLGLGISPHEPRSKARVSGRQQRTGA